MNNLELWKQVEKTDPSHTKPITGKAYSGNSPKPHHVIFKATETFGPCGIGWGFEIVEEKLLDGAMLEPNFYERIHMARVRVWYEWNGKRGTVEHVGQTVFSGKRRDGKPFTDEDAPKKSVTDGLIKALSMVGFAGDIFLGRYDDSKYVSDLRNEIAEEQKAQFKNSAPVSHAQGAEAGGEAAPRNSPPAELTAYVSLAKTALQNASTEAEVDEWWRDEKSKREGYSIIGGVNRKTGALEGTPEYLELAKAASDRKAEIRKVAA